MIFGIQLIKYLYLFQFKNNVLEVVICRVDTCRDVWEVNSDAVPLPFH